MIVEIRGSAKVIGECKKVSVLDKSIPFTIDENVSVAVIMAKNDIGTLIEALKGDKAVISFCKYGYNRIQKKCPMRLFAKCKCEKCQWYFIDQGTGDCIKVWSVIKQQPIYISAPKV